MGCELGLAVIVSLTLDAATFEGASTVFAVHTAVRPGL